MAEGILITAMMVFALRGYFLGVVPLLSRLLGYGATYYFSYRYGDALTSYIAANSSITVGPIALRIGSSLLLFFTSMIVSSIVLSLVFKLLLSLIPPLNVLFKRGSLGSGLLGASGNAAVAAILVLTGIWAYQLVAPGGTLAGQQLSSAASRVGISVNSLLARHSGTDLQRLLRDSGLLQQQARQSTPTPVARPNAPPPQGLGSALIVSSNNPGKRLSLGEPPAADLPTEQPLTTHNETAATTTSVQATDTELGMLEKLMRNETISELINHPALQRFVGEQLSQSEHANEDKK